MKYPPSSQGVWKQDQNKPSKYASGVFSYFPYTCMYLGHSMGVLSDGRIWFDFKHRSITCKRSVTFTCSKKYSSYNPVIFLQSKQPKIILLVLLMIDYFFITFHIPSPHNVRIFLQCLEAISIFFIAIASVT